MGREGRGGGSIDTLKSEVEIYLADLGWIDTLIWGGGRLTLTLKSEVEI